MVDVVEELNRQYRDTMVGVKSDKGIIPFQVQMIEGPKEDPQWFGRIAVGGRFRAVEKPLTGDKLCLKFPQVGTVNAGLGTFYISRRPLRQWKRGFKDDLVDRAAILPETFLELGLRTERGVQYYVNLFNRQYPAPMEALYKVLAEGLISCAFSPRFWFGISPRYDNVVIGYKYWVVGYVDDNGQFKLEKRCQHLKEELSQYINVQVEA